MKFENLRRRAEITASVRRFFAGRGYLEVETPIWCEAPIPEAHIDPFRAEGGYLQASPELFMKRLLAAGSGPVFQITKAFRKGERGAKHVPEMSLLEWYTPHADYTALMEACQGLFCAIADDLGLGSSIKVGEKEIDLKKPWRKVSVGEAYRLYGSCSAEEALSSGRFDEIMGLEIEPMLCGETPVILYDYPASMGALARKKERREPGRAL